MPLRGCGEAPHLCINWASSAVIEEGVFLTSSRLKSSVPRVVSSDRRSLTGDKDKEKTEGKKNQGGEEEKHQTENVSNDSDGELFR